MKRIGFLGGYSIDNTGDQMLGYAVRQAFRRRLPDAEQVLLSPALPGDTWRHAWTAERGLGLEVRPVPADDSTGWSKGFDAIVIGGGGLVQLSPEFRPFILGEASDWPSAVPAAWNAVGAENPPAYVAGQKPFYRAVKRCCETLSYVSVRNETTLRFIRRCGFSGPAPIVPDPTMQLHLPEDDASRGILHEAGVNTNKAVIGVSVGQSIRDARATTFYKELFHSLASGVLSGQRPCEVVLIPFGNVYGDPDLQALAQRLLPSAKPIQRPLSATERWRLIGALDWHICTRYHAMLAAFAQGVRFVAIDEYLSDAGGTSKIRDFVVSTELDGFYLCPYLSTAPAAKLANAAKLMTEMPQPYAKRLLGFQRDLESHYDAMVRALGLSPA